MLVLAGHVVAFDAAVPSYVSGLSLADCAYPGRDIGMVVTPRGTGAVRPRADGTSVQAGLTVSEPEA